ncbi:MULTISPECIES: hypothetical protein [Methylovorus]|jgi:ElaB/YqjD/DUF883 family membrane-anchored ribosome-binding protein|uniref:DUF883 domain-containing protein n=1 Tax=Methylovorus glucosotrophus (strain SIP3-4) TaxID=582744 RepID=C6XCU6_METGS|nr:MULTISPECIES: hypothetical protein [Methylovorus]ACT50371.1 protein of unknown function DUF883 ElaB [Methylovorus glucosotrophus SIP3-4]ADQ84345.1 conserved hypothetical protein [Methylovorus sp. MP688]KAF0844229.1 hypothetical protein FNL37_1673 [Methylovorus glucosotrophus]
MFSTSKTQDIQQKLETTAEDVKDNVTDIAEEAKVATAKLKDKLQDKSNASKDEILALLESVKDLLESKDPGEKLETLKDQLSTKLSDWSSTLRGEVQQAIKTGETRSRQIVRKRTLLSLSVVFGTGAALGYLLGSQHSED